MAVTVPGHACRPAQRLAEHERARARGQSDDDHYLRPHPPYPPSPPWRGRDTLSGGHRLVAGQPGEDREQRPETEVIVCQRLLDPFSARRWPPGKLITLSPPT
jgi:hypothetical protein